MIYTDEDKETDIEWLMGHGIDREDATSFINNLLLKWEED